MSQLQQQKIEQIRSSQIRHIPLACRDHYAKVCDSYQVAMQTATGDEYNALAEKLWAEMQRLRDLSALALPPMLAPAPGETPEQTLNRSYDKAGWVTI